LTNSQTNDYDPIGVAREGLSGAIAPPKMPKRYIFNKKVPPNFYFSAQKSAREAYSGHSWVRVPPPKRNVPSKTNSWLR